MNYQEKAKENLKMQKDKLLSLYKDGIIEVVYAVELLTSYTQALRQLDLLEQKATKQFLNKFIKECKKWDMSKISSEVSN